MVLGGAVVELPVRAQERIPKNAERTILATLAFSMVRPSSPSQAVRFCGEFVTSDGPLGPPISATGAFQLHQKLAHRNSCGPYADAIAEKQEWSDL